MEIRVYKNQKECDKALSLLVKNIIKTPILSFFISQEQYIEWDREVIQRFRKLWDWDNTVKVFDVDECFSCWIMSVEHFEELFKFLTK